jgi:uncharacterized coiled-coil DUF342 family protein
MDSNTADDQVVTLRGTIDMQSAVIEQLTSERDQLKKRVDQLHEICLFNAETIRDMQRARR